MTSYSIQFEICGTAAVATYRRFLVARLREIESRIELEKEQVKNYARKAERETVFGLIQRTFQSNGTDVAKVKECVRYDVMIPISDALREELAHLDSESDEFLMLWELNSSLGHRHLSMSSTHG